MSENKKLNFSPDKTLFTLKEASFLLNLKEDYLRSLIRKGISPIYMQPTGKWGKILFHIDQLNFWVEQQNQEFLRKKNA
jgi:excisionase family DNA binding protein